MAKAILVTRVSTRRQAAEGESLEAQLAKLQAWAAREGHEVIAIFSDEGVTGTTMERPGSRAALTLACRTKDSLIAVTSLSRWGRTVEGVLSTCNTLIKSGSGLVSLAEAFDLRTSSGRLLLAVLSAANAFQVEVQQEATLMTLARLRVVGRKISSREPYGWSFDGDLLIEVPHEQVVLAEMAKLRGEGQSYEAIARLLNARGTPPKYASEWSGRSIRLILTRLAKVRAVA